MTLVSSFLYEPIATQTNAPDLVKLFMASKSLSLGKLDFANLHDESPESLDMVKALASLDHLKIVGCQMSNKQLTHLFREMSKGNMKQIELDGLIPDEGFLYFPPVPNFVLAQGLSSVS